MHKNLFLLLLPLLCCCTTDTVPSVAVSAETTHQKNAEKDADYPANSANPYDLAGRLHQEVLDAYLPLETRPSTVAKIIERLETAANSNSMFVALQSEGYNSPTVSKLQYLLNHPLLSHSEIVNDSGLTLAARQNLSSFITQVLEWQDLPNEFDDFYPILLTYEAGIIADKNFTTHDKKVLLTTAAITRYGLYFSARQKRKPRDRDWDHWITAISAGIEGSTQSTASAVLFSAAASAHFNN